MKSLTAVNTSNQKILARKVRVASSLIQRAIGLLGTSTLPDDEGIWLKPCKSVHTFFMRYPIDVLFLDPEGTIVHQESLVPWRISRWVSRAAGVLEVAAGTAGSVGHHSATHGALETHSGSRTVFAGTLSALSRHLPAPWRPGPHSIG